MSSIEIRLADITELDTDVIVNAANNKLVIGGGVCKAIFEAAGQEQLRQACDKIGWCDTGSAIVTPGFNLGAKYIIHAVGPKWQGGGKGEPRQLYDAYGRSLELCVDNGCESIGFPLLSTGIRKYPVDKSWEVAVKSCLDFFSDAPDSDLRVVFAVRDSTAKLLGEKALRSAEDGSSPSSVGEKPRKDYAEFVAGTICGIKGQTLARLRGALTRDWLSFSIVRHQDVTSDILAEKACDYFELVETRTGKAFEEHLRSYVGALDSIVAPHIAPAPNAGRGAPSAAMPRARRYYDKARDIGKAKDLGLGQILDYSRIMLCLYMKVINAGHGTIENFDYPSECLEPQAILQAMRREEVPAFPLGPKRPRFDLGDPYGKDSCVLVLTTVCLYSILNQRGGGNEAK